MSARRALVPTVALVLAIGLMACGNESRHDVKQSVEQISSISSEGAIMADDLARGKTKTTFVRVHGEELSAQAEHEAEKLNDAPADPDLHEPIEKGIELSADIGGAIDDLRVSPQDSEAARKSAGDLRRWADEAQKLAEAL